MLTRRTILAAASALAPPGPAFAASAPEQSSIQDVQVQRITMKITRNGATPSTQASKDYFTGTVRLDTPFKGTGDARIGGAFVTFEPGARTAWHTHPLGQTLIVTAGCGWVQQHGGAKEEIRPGDVVWIPAGEKHWHGATATTAMTHIAIAEARDGKTVDWMEKVSDAEYAG
jgi:quercetin dioxygenase-like cupin family protein